jgi:hypothetical protein
LFAVFRLSSGAVELHSIFGMCGFDEFPYLVSVAPAKHLKSRFALPPSFLLHAACASDAMFLETVVRAPEIKKPRSRHSSL